MELHLKQVAWKGISNLQGLMVSAVLGLLPGLSKCRRQAGTIEKVALKGGKELS